MRKLIIIALYTLIATGSFKAQSDAGQEIMINAIFKSFKTQSFEHVIALTPESEIEPYFKQQMDESDPAVIDDLTHKVQSGLDQQIASTASYFEEVSAAGVSFGINWSEIELLESHVELYNPISDLDMCSAKGFVTISYNGAHYNLDFSGATKMREWYFLPNVYQLDKIKRSPKEMKECTAHKAEWKTYCIQFLSESFENMSDQQRMDACDCMIEEIGDDPNRDCASDFKPGMRFGFCWKELIQKHKGQ